MAADAKTRQGVCSSIPRRFASHPRRPVTPPRNVIEIPVGNRKDSRAKYPNTGAWGFAQPDGQQQQTRTVQDQPARRGRPKIKKCRVVSLLYTRGAQ
jgi:hypothetical protein